MAKTKASEASYDADDWLVVSDDENFAQPQDREKPAPGLEVTRNQILHSARPDEQHAASELESELNQIPQHWSLFQLLVWHNGLEQPIELVDEHHKPLVVAVHESCPKRELQEKVHEMVLTQPQLRGVFPEVTRENICDVIQVCERWDEQMSWVPLERGRNAEEDAHKADEVEQSGADTSSSVVRLQLTSQVEQFDNQKWDQLLVETRFEVPRGGELTDWRRGRFYSEIQEVSWRFTLQIGQLVDALDTDKRWYESRIVDMDAVYVKVHYRGWTSKWDEWLRRTSWRLAPLHTKVPNWRAFQVGDEILVGSEVPGKKYPEWRNACVTACDKADGLLQIEVEVDGKKKWMDAQDELICPKGTHKAVNAGKKAGSEVLAAPASLLFNYFERPEELPPSPSGEGDGTENEVESLREATHAMHVAGSDAGGDEWCVVGDDCEENVETSATTEDNNKVDTTVEPETEETEAEMSAASIVSANSSSHGENRKAQATQSIIPTMVGQIIATTTEVLDCRLDSTISEEDAWRYQLQIDQLIDARDTDNVWYESRVVALSSTLVKLHYRGWTSKWDEWIERTSSRIAPLHTKVRNWRDFKVGNTLMVGQNVATKKYPEWRNAVVTACEACQVDSRLRIEVDVDGTKQWMDAQDEMLCPPGTHKAVNSLMLNHIAPLF